MMNVRSELVEAVKVAVFDKTTLSRSREDDLQAFTRLREMVQAGMPACGQNPALLEPVLSAAAGAAVDAVVKHAGADLDAATTRAAERAVEYAGKAGLGPHGAIELAQAMVAIVTDAVSGVAAASLAPVEG